MTQAMVKIDPKYLEIIRTSLDKTGLPKPFVQEVELLKVLLVSKETGVN